MNKLQIPVAHSIISFCDSCKLGKIHQLPFTRCPITATQPLELVYSNLWGPTPISSVEGYRYYIVFVDAHTRYTWLYPLKLKLDALPTFMNFHKFVELQYNSKLKSLQTDNGGEFKAFLLYLQTYGIQPRFFCPHTHQQNGVAERKHRHIAKIGLTLLAHAHMPLRFWLEAFLVAVYTINLLPSSVINSCSPFEMLYHKPPDYVLQPFGCSCLKTL